MAMSSPGVFEMKRVLVITLLTFFLQIDFDACLDQRPEYHRAKLNWDTDDGVPLAVSTGSQCSSRLLSLRSCHCLLEMPSSDSTKRLTRGSLVTALLLPKLIT